MRKARSQLVTDSEESVIELLQLVGVWFQVLLTPLIGVLFIVRSPYFALSVAD